MVPAADAAVAGVTLAGLGLDDGRGRADKFLDGDSMVAVDDATSAVVMLHRAGDNGAGCQVEVSSSSTWDGAFEAACAAVGAVVAYPTIRVQAGAELNATINAGCAQVMMRVRRLMDELEIAPERIYIGGFDAGGLLALHLAGRLPMAIGGFFCLQGGGAMESASLLEVLNTRKARGVPNAVCAVGIEDRAGEAPGFLDAVVAALRPENADGTHCWRLADAGDDLVSKQVELLASWLEKRLGHQGAADGALIVAETPEVPAEAPRVRRRDQLLVDVSTATFTLEEADRGQTRAVFRVPPGTEALLCRFPVNCRGAAFAVEPHGDGTVSCLFYSPKPKDTAEAIAARINQRFKDPSSAGAEACTVS
ncbi:hypothetical protein M885DRAFT_507458 [Pelagophyceae sp. CCMP2097]|nr:hypothetical protein M885DRAFT_507458 [Pelagophyceae sp. CCMP2097]